MKTLILIITFVVSVYIKDAHSKDECIALAQQVSPGAISLCNKPAEVGVIKAKLQKMAKQKKVKEAISKIIVGSLPDMTEAEIIEALE